MKNKKLIYLLVFAFILINKTLEAKEQDLKLEIIEYLIKVGDLSPSNDLHNYCDNVFIVELIKNEKFCNKGEGVFKFGTFADHTKTYLLIMSDNKCEMFDTKKLDTVLLREIEFLKKNKKPSDKILKYIEATIAEYQNNLKVIPWTE